MKNRWKTLKVDRSLRDDDMNANSDDLKEDC